MIFRELNNAKCKTYLLASESTERAVIVDPLKDRVERYLAVLAYHRLKLDLIIDTHTHADHRSGAHELAFFTAVSIRFLHRGKTRELNRTRNPAGIEQIAAADPIHDKEL